jgi:hypothetical protein
MGTAFVDRGIVPQTVLSNCFFEKAQSGFLVAMRRKQEVDGVAVRVDGG